MIRVELDGIIYTLPSSASEILGTCRSYDPPTDADGGCLRLKENRAAKNPQEVAISRQIIWIKCATSLEYVDEGKCPFVD